MSISPNRMMLGMIFFVVVLPLLIMAYCGYFAQLYGEPWLWAAGVIMGLGVGVCSWKHFRAV